MGDRAIIEVREGDESVYLYTHWRGSDAPQTLQNALRRGKDRWTDNGYLARIIFSDLVSGYEDELTGFGIYASPIGASKHLLVDVTEQTVTIDDGASVSFEQYSDPSHIPEPPEEEIDKDEEDASPPEEDASAVETMADDTLERPARQLNPRIVQEIGRIRKERDETATSTGELT